MTDVIMQTSAGDIRIRLFTDEAPDTTANFLRLVDKWVVTSQMMKIIAVTAFFKFITSPIGTSFTIINKQDIAFYLTFLSLVLRFFIMLNFHNSISSLFWAFSLSSAIYYIVYHIFVFRLLSQISKDNE